jgi:hypothetical protein
MNKGEVMNKVSPKDRSILRDLAKQYMAVCESDRNKEAKLLWRDHNSMIQTRPPVYCMVFFATHMEEEIGAGIPPLQTSEDLHEVEYWLRTRLWASTIPDDTVYDPWYPMEASRQKASAGYWGIERKQMHDQKSRGWRNLPVIKKIEDLRKLEATPHVVLDANPPEVQRVRDIFGDILTVHVNKSTIYPIWGGTDLSEEAGALIGLEELMYMFYKNPEVIHKLMTFMRDGVLKNLEQGEAAGDWSTAENQNYSLPPHTKELPEPEANSYNARLKDLWFFTHAQEFEGVSPQMHEEFLLNYQLPIMEKFGLVNYGCCETLDRKIDILRKIPNLRRICLGPMSDVKMGAEKIGKDYIVSWRPNPATMVSNGFDPDSIRKIIRQALKDSKGCSIEIMLKELMTVQGDLSRLFKWTEIANQEARNF